MFIENEIYYFETSKVIKENDSPGFGSPLLDKADTFFSTCKRKKQINRKVLFHPGKMNDCDTHAALQHTGS